MVLVAFGLGALGSVFGQLADDFEEAGDLGSSERFEIRQASEGATVQLGEPASSALGLWGKWTAPANGIYATRTAATEWIQASVDEGTHRSYPKDLSQGNNSGGGPLLLRFEARKGTTYAMSFSGEEIAVQLELSSLLRTMSLTVLSIWEMTRR
jgi:hypothetical protein